MVGRETILQGVPALYAVGEVVLGGKQYLGLASENRQGKLFLADADTGSIQEIPGGPGGVMSVVGVPGEDALLCIEEFYPVFDARTAKIVKIQPEIKADGSVAACRTVLTQAPYVHRISHLHEWDGDYIAAGILSSEKDFQDDWSRPGSLMIGRYDAATPHVRLEPVYDGIFRHHAMYVKKNDQGYDDLYVGGTEGVFRCVRQGAHWAVTKILSIPTSDIVVFDFDGDGVDELAIIEGFHGNLAAVFKKTEAGFERILEIPMEFGHVLWGGFFMDQRVLLLGSRSGRKNLSLYRLTPGADGALLAEEEVLDEGKAPAQVLVTRTAEGPTVIATNHGAGELTKYQVFMQ